MASPTTTRRAEALALAEETLRNIELHEIPPIAMARKAYRLARLLDDTEAMQWLQFEIHGYRLTQPDNSFEPGGWEAAVRSNRDTYEKDGKHTASAASLGRLQADIENGKIQLGAASDPSVSLHSANERQYVTAPSGNSNERRAIRQFISEQQAILDNIVGAIHSYMVEREQELRFGAAVETAFEVVRAEVDAKIASLVPDALPKLSAAFENAASNNPEHWANAASTCRRLLKATADALRPPGDPVDGRPMTDAHYINRLVDWILHQGESGTAVEMIRADLEYLGRRLDAAVGAGAKGAHDEVDRFAASRFLTGTYLVLGDVLRMSGGETPAAEGVAAEPADLPANPDSS